MASLTNIRFHTITKVVPDEGDLTLASVMVDNGILLVQYTDGPYFILGSLSYDDYTIPTPLEPQCPCGENTSNSNVLATLLKGVDGVTPDMSDYYNKEVIEEKLAAKQDAISDLEAIRSGAAKGATALQSVPREYVTQRELQERGYATTTQVDAKQDIISDLDAIREGAAKGATAIQSVKTINGESIVGSGDITIQGGGGDVTKEYVDEAVEAVNVKGEDGYVYSNGEKVDMRIRRSLIPIGTLIPAKANLNTIAYLKVGNYYCSQTANAKTISNCPVEVAFSMEVFNPLSENLDDETTATYTYRIRKITAYNTGVQYVQYCNTSGTAGTWTYGSWYVVPRTSFSLASDKNGGSAVKGGSNRGVYIDASGTFQQMGYTVAKSVPSNAVFTDTNTKVTSVDNHYAPSEDADAAINAPEGEVVVGLKRDAAGHVVGVTSTPMSGGGSSEYESNIEDKTLAMPNAVGGIAKGTTISELEGKTYNEMFDDLLFPTVNPTFTAPSASIAFKSYSSTQEVGATGPTASNFTVGYNAGAITLNGTKQANRGGTQDTANSFIYVNGSASNKTLPSNVTLGSTTFKYRAAFAEGPQPKNNKGGDYSTPLAASYVDSSAITLNGTYPWYASTVGVTTSSPVAKQALVAWNATAGKMYTGDNGFTLEASGTVPQVIKVPNSRTIASMEMYDTGAEKWKAVSMSGTWAASTETISVNGTNITYTVYTYSGATRGQVKLRIKF